jgi:hypothetical protein
MSYRPISPTFDLQAIHFSLTRRWTIKTGQAMVYLELLIKFTINRFCFST